MTKNLALACALSLLWCATGNAATQCGLLSLGLPDGEDAVATDINDAGTAVGLSQQVAFTSSKGTATYLIGLDGAYSQSVALGLNKSGRVVGASPGPDGNRHATVWNNGTPRDLGLLPGGTWSQAEDVNDQGHVVGSAIGSDLEIHAFIWTGQKITELQDGLPNEGSVALAINNVDQVVGYDMEPGTRNARAVMWDHGTVTYLGSFGGAGISTAYDINDSGQIVGQSRTGAGRLRGFLWENGVLTNLGTLGGMTSQALAINSAGAIVGVTTNSANRLRAFIWKNGSMKNLDPETATNSGTALAISNTGWVVGYTRTPPAEFRFRVPFRWKKKC